MCYEQNDLRRRNSLKEVCGVVGTLGHASLIWGGPYTVLKVISVLHWLSYCLQIRVSTPSLGQFFPRRALVSHAKMCVLLSPIALPNGSVFFYSVVNRMLRLLLYSSLLFLPVHSLTFLRSGTFRSEKRGLSTPPLGTTVHSYTCTCIMMPRCSLFYLKVFVVFIFQLEGHLRARNNISGATNQVTSTAAYYSFPLAPRRAKFHTRS